eukprot:8681963-Pyramimonas_sp.AAC.1
MSAHERGDDDAGVGKVRVDAKGGDPQAEALVTAWGCLRATGGALHVYGQLEGCHKASASATSAATSAWEGHLTREVATAAQAHRLAGGSVASPSWRNVVTHNQLLAAVAAPFWLDGTAGCQLYATD